VITLDQPARAASRAREESALANSLDRHVEGGHHTSESTVATQQATKITVAPADC